MPYDSKGDTMHHIHRVSYYIHDIVRSLLHRADCHDETKLMEPEKSVLDKMTPRLGKVTYDSDEYRKMMRTEMVPMFSHHKKFNRHHAEHFKAGIEGMNLVDIVEMFCDWKAATERHDDGNIRASIAANEKKHRMSKQLTRIFKNTVRDLGW